MEEEAEGALGGRCANWWEFFVTAVVSGLDIEGLEKPQAYLFRFRNHKRV